MNLYFIHERAYTPEELLVGMNWAWVIQIEVKNIFHKGATNPHPPGIMSDTLITDLADLARLNNCYFNFNSSPNMHAACIV